MTSLLDRLVRRHRVARPMITVYTRRQCCCCHRAIALLEDRQRQHGFELELVDIDTHPKLASQHGQWVPVVAVDGKVRFRGVVNPVLLDRLLLAAHREVKRA